MPKTNSISPTQPAGQIWWLFSQTGQSWSNFSFSPIFVKFWIYDSEVLIKLHIDYESVILRDKNGAPNLDTKEVGNDRFFTLYYALLRKKPFRIGNGKFCFPVHEE